MRLALLTHEPFYPPSGGGSAEAVYLVEEMVRRGHEIHLFCPAFPDHPGVAEQFSIRIHPFTGWQMGRYTNLRSLKYLAYPRALRNMVLKAATEIEFDAIFSQHAISAVAAGKLKSNLNLPVVLNFLDYLTVFMESWPRWIMPRVILNRLMRFELNLPIRYDADAVLTVSTELAKRFIDNGYPESRTQPIHYGYDATLFPFSSTSPTLTPTVVMHGSFDTHHLGPLAIEAITQITRAKPETHFLFIGKETAALANLTKRVRRSVRSANIQCTGFVDYNLIADGLGQAHVGIIPYESSVGTHSAFVAKMVEYAAVGLPVVSTPLSGVMAFFKNEASICFSKFDTIQFARDVLRLLDTPPLERNRQRLAKRVAAELDWKVICRKAVDRLEAVAS